MFTLANPALTAWLVWARPFFASCGYSAAALDAWTAAPAHAALLEEDLRRKVLAAMKPR